MGRFNQVYRYYYTGATFAVTEPDGVRIIGSDTCDFIQKVPGEPSPWRIGND